MRILFLILLAFPPLEVWAKSMRVVRLSESDMETVFVEPGFSTLIKFDSHPQPGLIGDQDGFKVEYLKNMVAIKPLVSRGKTNLFLFTKEGQFNFQLLAGSGRHDNIVYAQMKVAPELPAARIAKPILIDDLLTRKIGRTVQQGNVKLTLQTVSTPISRTTLVLKIEVSSSAKENLEIERENLLVFQDRKAIAFGNLFAESRVDKEQKIFNVLLLLRMDQLNPKLPLRLELKTKAAKSLALPFSADLGPPQRPKKGNHLE
ncbi:MAG: TrbG/VirB9 family P-type conjugative transfer protein [Bdellovibrionaceae bacterium]|nr:TrbG/VirB9 family P-type conjugative transfer protein [Pseudobdellovibrionaceae bacterium]